MHFLQSASTLQKILLYIGIGILLAAVFRYALPLLLPFLIAMLLAVLLRNPSIRFAKITKIPTRISASFLAALSALLLFGLAGFFIWKLLFELFSFAETLLEAENPLVLNLQMMAKRLGDFVTSLPFLRGENAETVKKEVMGAFFDMLKNMAVSISAKIPKTAAKLISAVPSFFLSLVVTVLSAVYFCADYDKIRMTVRKNLQNRHLVKLTSCLQAVKTAFSKMLRSYLILFLFTFSLLLLGFAVLKEKYAFLLALLTAVVDSLPVFGTGTVLVPMVLYHFFVGNYKMATGLLLLYLTVLLSRQILEPRILGKEMGLHPLFMLLCLYVGFRLFGVGGMILSPFAAVVIKALMKAFSVKKGAPDETSAH